MRHRSWMGILAAIAIWVFTAAPGWTADPKAAMKPPPTQQQKVDKDIGKAKEPLDLNRATKAQLMALEGIGERTAQRIIQNRPYVKKDQLKSMNILTPQEYERIKDDIIARHPSRKK